ncbi:hypothetical protein [Streptomyces morookaense]|uniref:Uncharacterized protein n=1 Tax=Streptomyces morookaense TaxID=1970 RepID=A0A7Y7B1V2_STRMO|nr:hypothetical protein [Streptomyces morookaense]NVK77480.1 hypothetical protein [Streptomyces morookaense]GHF22003.1 hypothetical protein GCM10010359_24600 [Streptomyces morookaense]
MNTVAPRTTSVTVHPAEERFSADALRFAELAARSGLEPELARRLENSPAAVLAEFGLSAGHPEPAAGTTLLIEDLSRSTAGALVVPTWTVVAPTPQEPTGATAGRC